MVSRLSSRRGHHRYSRADILPVAHRHPDSRVGVEVVRYVHEVAVGHDGVARVHGHVVEVTVLLTVDHRVAEVLVPVAQEDAVVLQRRRARIVVHVHGVGDDGQVAVALAGCDDDADAAAAHVEVRRIDARHGVEPARLYGRSLRLRHAAEERVSRVRARHEAGGGELHAARVRAGVGGEERPRARDVDAEVERAEALQVAEVHHVRPRARFGHHAGELEGILRQCHVLRRDQAVVGRPRGVVVSHEVRQTTPIRAGTGRAVCPAVHVVRVLLVGIGQPAEGADKVGREAAVVGLSLGEGYLRRGVEALRLVECPRICPPVLIGADVPQVVIRACL